jgi:hypothetical protein
MIWYNDDDIEKKQTNWQNSEVMRIFAAQYLDPKLAGGAQFLLADDEPEEEEEVEGEDNCGDGALMNAPKPVVLVVKEQLRSELNGVIEKLGSLSSQYGNEKVRYMMERAVDDLSSTMESKYVF